MARGLLLPTQIYPIFENALRAAAGESIDDHQRKIADLWSRFSHVAANNPHAWSRQPLSPEQIATVTDDNRIIGFPYTKSMNANIDTDQAAGLIMCSVAAAEAAGVPRDRWVFALSGAEAHDHYYVSERADLHSSPAIRAAGAAALAGAGVGIDDIAHVDVYSCFPSAVQMGANALALSLDRQLTVTGGLSFAGGPGNNYSTHAIAAMLDALRADPGSLGLVTALGWYATKHAVGVYSTEPPLSSAEFARSNPQREVDALPTCTPEPDYAGDVAVETYTVMHERDGSPAIGLVACRTPSGGRTWGNVRDADGLRALLDADPIGTAGTLAVDGTFALA
jgi:acetyl-CoA C-acetyltransferase